MTDPTDPRDPAKADRPTRERTSTNTIWIWISVVVPFVPILLWRPLYWNADYRYELSWNQFVLLVIVPSAVLGILAGFLDWRELSRRNVDRPFHWAYSFFVLFATNAIYIIGRTVVVARRTRQGSAPLWVWIIGAIPVFLIMAFVAYLLAALPSNFN